EGPGLAATIEETAARLQRGLDLEHGPLVRAALFRAGGAARLLLVVHHLVVDGVSWRILLDDLATACSQASRGEAIVLPDKTTSFRQWATALEEHARQGRMDGEIGYWLADRRRDAPSIPLDTPGGANTEGSVR